MRAEVINPDSSAPKLVRLFWLYKIKRMDAFANDSMGTGFGWGAKFDSPPNLVHYLNGIIISYRAHIGKNCTIMQQVTIGERGERKPLKSETIASLEQAQKYSVM